ncbi:MAG: hypothetical protein QNI84_08060 [Henriciella sp.]|nr:hypothetical protein [Henriciella sp.]
MSTFQDELSLQELNAFLAQVARDQQVAAQGRTLGGEPVTETLYYLPDHDDELIGHHATLDTIATFLAFGDRNASEGDYWHGRQAEPGETQALYAMDFIADRTLTRIEGARFRIEPALPAQCDFMAVRYGPGDGWDTDTINEPQDSLTEFVDQYGTFGEMEMVIEDVAFARTRGRGGSVTYRLDGDTALPVLLSELMEES